MSLLQQAADLNNQGITSLLSGNYQTGIEALSDSISAVSTTTDEARFHAGDLAARLARLIEEAKLSCARIEDTTIRLKDAHAAAELQLRQTPPPMEMPSVARCT